MSQLQAHLRPAQRSARIEQFWPILAPRKSLLLATTFATTSVHLLPILLPVHDVGQGRIQYHCMTRNSTETRTSSRVYQSLSIIQSY